MSDVELNIKDFDHLATHSVLTPNQTQKERVESAKSRVLSNTEVQKAMNRLSKT